jgi:hypothetical protein
VSCVRSWGCSVGGYECGLLLVSCKRLVLRGEVLKWLFQFLVPGSVSSLSSWGVGCIWGLL